MPYIYNDKCFWNISKAQKLLIKMDEGLYKQK